MSVTLTSQLNGIQNQILSYYLPPVYAIGVLGNTINALIFSSKQLRTNTCSWYFVCVSISHLLLLHFVCLIRIISTLSGYDPLRYVLGLCDFRSYMYVLSIVLSRHFLCLISFDRWLVTSASERLRRLSTPRRARWIIGCSLIFWSIFSIHTFIGYRVQSNGCTQISNTTYGLFFTTYSIVTAISPMVIMSLCSFGTISNIRKRVVHPIQTAVRIGVTEQSVQTHKTGTDAQTAFRHKRDRQLIRLALVQAASYMILNIPISIYPIYQRVLNSLSSITGDQQAILSFVSILGLVFLYTYSATTFFIYTLASSVFRQQCVTICKQWWIHLKRHL